MYMFMCIRYGAELDKQHTESNYLFQPKIPLEEAKTINFDRMQPALHIEGFDQVFDIVAGDIKTDPVKLAQVKYQISM